MRKLVTNYVFNKTAKTVTFSDYASIELERVFIIVDVTNNITIYQANDPGFGGTVSTNVLTLDYNTNTVDFNNTDELQIFYEQDDQQISGDFYAAITSGQDVLGTLVTGDKNNQIEISFDTAPGVDLITNTTSGGGSVTQSNGHSLYSTGTATTSQAKGVSVQSVSYRPAHEIYSYFSAAFTSPTSANSHQRIGFYDTNNGFFIGYEGTSFGLTRRSGGVDNRTPRASFNGDPLDGSVSSKFTRNGTPEAINFAYSNLYRIRFAWLGSACIFFDIFSPDGAWVNFHVIKMPNSQLDPSVQNPDLPMTVDVSKTSADATSLTVYTACWAAGTTSQLSKVTSTLTDNTLASLTRSIIAGRASNGGGTYYNVKVTPSGSLTVAIGDITGIVGQNTMANSIPVAIASNQSSIPVAATQSGTWNINNVSGTISLPTGASTEAKQDSQITELQSIKGHVDGVETKLDTLITQTDGVESSLSSIDGKLNSLGQKTMANSVPVTLSSDQSNVPVSANGNVVSSGNSTNTPLAGNAVFTGTSEDVLQYGVIQITLRANVDSAIDGVRFLFSADNITFYSSDEYSLAAGKFKTYSLAPVARYFKIEYTNGSSAQSSFLIQTIYKQVYAKPSSHRLADSLSAQDDAEVVQSVLVAKLPDGNFANINTTRDGHLIFEPAQNQKDAFDRLITVQPIQLSSHDHRITKHPDDFDELIVGSATSVLNATTASVDITTTTASGDSVIRQSYESYEYTRGNTQQGLFSLNLNGGAKTNNIRMFGMGDSENGAFIGVDGTGFFVMRRSKTSGSVVDVKTYQSSFNYDKLDGTGVSGITIDLTKQNLFSISYSWLGTNVIIYTLTVGGVKRPFHIDNVGNSLTTAWCQSGQLPIYFQNTNTGVTDSSTTFKVGCSAAFSFGSSKGYSEYQAVSSQVTAITINTTEKVCAGIRLRPGLKYVTIEPSDYQLLAASGTTVAYYKVIQDAVLTGATWANQGEISQILTNNPTYTNGRIVQEGYFSLASATRLAIAVPSTQETKLGYSINGTPSSLIIVVRTDTGNGSFYFAGSWKEIF